MAYPMHHGQYSHHAHHVPHNPHASGQGQYTAYAGQAYSASGSSSQHAQLYSQVGQPSAYNNPDERDNAFPNMPARPSTQVKAEPTHTPDHYSFDAPTSSFPPATQLVAVQGSSAGPSSSHYTAASEDVKPETSTMSAKVKVKIEGKDKEKPKRKTKAGTTGEVAGVAGGSAVKAKAVKAVPAPKEKRAGR